MSYQPVSSPPPSPSAPCLLSSSPPFPGTPPIPTRKVGRGQPTKRRPIPRSRAPNALQPETRSNLTSNTPPLPKRGGHNIRGASRIRSNTNILQQSAPTTTPSPPPRNPRNTFKDSKGGQVFTTAPSIAKRSPTVTGADLQKTKLRSLPSTSCKNMNPDYSKNSTSSEYPTKSASHTFFTPLAPTFGAINFDKNIHSFLQSIEPTLKQEIWARLYNSNPSRAMLRSTSFSHTNPKNEPTTRPRLATQSTGKEMPHNPQWDAILYEKEEGITYHDGLIKGGRLQDIVIAITNPTFSSQQCLNALLLTYRSFITPMKLLNFLIARFHVESTTSNDAAFKQYFEERKRKPIQLRTGNVIRRWIENHWYDFENDSELVTRLMNWIKGPLTRSNFGTLPTTLEKLIEKKKKGKAGASSGTIVFMQNQPAPFLPKTDLFIDFSPVEVARQIAMIEFRPFYRIHPTECMNQSWTKKDLKETVSPHIGQMIKQSNAFPMWIANQILEEPKVKVRAKLISNFIKIAHECDVLNNFNAVMEILAGLSISPVHRLKLTWELVKKKHVERLEELRAMICTKDNWKSYRTTLKQRDPPCIPYFGMYLTDLTFIGDGHPDYIEGDIPDCINFVKCRQMAVVIQDIQQYQQKSYSFEEVPVIHNALTALNHCTEDELYELSLQVEPRASR